MLSLSIDSLHYIDEYLTTKDSCHLRETCNALCEEKDTFIMRMLETKSYPESLLTLRNTYCPKYASFFLTKRNDWSESTMMTMTMNNDDIENFMFIYEKCFNEYLPYKFMETAIARGDRNHFIERMLASQTFELDYEELFVDCCVRNKTEQAEKFIICGKVDPRHEMDRALRCCAGKGNVKAMEWLVSIGCDFNAIDGYPLRSACLCDNEPVARYLLSLYPDQQSSPILSGRILLCAIHGGNVSIVRSVIKKGADVNIPGILHNDDDFVSVLDASLMEITYGQVPPVDPFHPLLPLTLALYMYADSRNTRSSECKPLTVQICELLLQHGADANNEEVLQLVHEKELFELYPLLRKYGAKI